jgi:hypothetical protein
MKKTLLLIILILTSVLCATTVTTDGITATNMKVETTSDCRLRTDAAWRTAGEVARVKASTPLTVDAVYGDWVEVLVESGSDHAGKKGYMWVERIDFTTGTITLEGLCLRSSPNVGDNLVAKVRVGAKIKILSIVPTWYRTSWASQVAWVSAALVK